MGNNIIFVAITGGSGAGKSTLAMALQDKYPDKIGVIQLDDYFKPAVDAPKMGEYVNWDHPDALYFDKFYQDLGDLAAGKTVVINTKNERLNPEYKHTEQRISVEFQPKPIMLVEGYLVLHDERIRNLMTTSVWLEVAHSVRWKRRVHFKDDVYEKKVLVPMYEKFVAPTKVFAEHIIDVNDIETKDVVKKLEDIIASL